MRYRTVPMILFGLVCVIVTSYVILTFEFKSILKETDESMIEMQAKLELQRVKFAIEKHRKMLDDLIHDYAVWDSFYLALKHNNGKWVRKTVKNVFDYNEDIAYVRAISTDGMNYLLSNLNDDDTSKLDISVDKLIEEEAGDKYIEINEELYYIRIKKVTDEREMRSSGNLVIISKMKVEPSMNFLDLGDNELKYNYEIEDGLLISRIYLNEDIAFKSESSIEGFMKISHGMVIRLISLTFVLATFILGLFLFILLKANKAMKVSMTYLEMVINEEEIKVLDDMNNEEVHCFLNNIKRISEKIQDKINLIKKQNSDTLSLLVKAIEAKDAYTCGHSERVMLLSMTIARHLDNVNHEALTQAALLHDIGKIAIGDAILRKASRLTDEEYSHIQTHPKRGSDILSVSDSLGFVSRIIVEHHERYDGQGYPEGRLGDQICIEARIIAVADAFDAMVSDRPYRKGMTFDKAFEIILDEKGKQFDSNIVEEFIVKKAEMKEIINKFKVGVIC
ncbi:HD-GYP domain-containing protein [Acidaminobacter sp. JC074]|uniref:HD-GYP domain-containing protein n=1 Tax=Acidaminobacter sp. JC074 TaxID=2530199 RepID=UPI001F11718B|nr:HD-GYP domain-containing protein [Acidaminobacter sp. JC074]MCH4887839.1 HD-GYP domain-containing protein [Acidaminobacter sp. JC074]